MKRTEKETYKDQFAAKYAEYVREKKFEPSRREFNDWCDPILIDLEADGGTNTITYRDVFSSFTELRTRAFEQNPDLADFVFNESTFDDAYSDALDEQIRTHNKFIITTAVCGKPVDIEFYNALKTYAKVNDAVILLLPCMDVKGSKRIFELNLDPALKDSWVAYRDLKLNNNVGTCAIRISAKQINPLTGLDGFPVKANRSLFVASCKQMLKNIPYYKGEIPRFMASTGAVTINDFTNDYFISGRTSRIAENDYQAGAFILEIQDEEIYYKRPIQARPDGSFTDLDNVYHPDGTVTKSKDALFVQGDSHVGAEDSRLASAIRNAFVKDGYVKTVVLHDLCNSGSISHHEANDWVKLVQRINDGTNSLMNEINMCVDYLNQLTYIGLNVVVVNSNHDNHIERCIREMAFVKNRDFTNTELLFETYLDITKGNIKGGVLEYLVTKKATHKLNNPEQIRWLALDESYKKYGIELGFHGHLGANGAKGSLRTFGNAFQNVVLGHSHSGAINKGVMQVGTTSELDMEYNKGLSSWTRSCCLCHEDGSKQLIDFIPDKDGGYKYRV